MLMSITIASDDPSRDPIDNRRSSASRADGVKCVTGCVDVDHWASHRNYATSGTDNLKLRKKARIGTWNVQGLVQTGKLSIIINEITRCNISIAGISETHWRGKGHFTSSNHTIYFSGKESESVQGVAFVVSNKINNSVIGYNAINSRLIHLKINAKPFVLNLLQTYAPTASAPDQDAEDFYESVEEVLEKIPKNEMVIVMGDMNAKVGNTENDNHLRNVVGKYGLGDRNERGERLIQFCLDNNFTITNTTFRQPKRRLYTWTSPGGLFKNQIDYIMIKSRWRSSVCTAKTLPSADCGSDHQLLIAEIVCKLRNNKRTAMKILPAQINPVEFEKRIEQQILSQTDTNNSAGVEEAWTSLKSTIETAIRHETNNNSRKKQHWMSEETLELIKQRRNIKCKEKTPENAEEYRQLNQQIQRLSRKDKNNYLNNLCDDIQKHADHNNPKDLFTTIRALTKQFKPKTWMVKNNNDELVTDLNGVLDVWSDYCECLYRDEEQTLQYVSWTKEPDIMIDEIVHAIKRLKSDKACGIDGIPGEFLKLLNPHILSMVHQLCKRIWETCEWPKDWTTSVILPLHKKGATNLCNNYRMIALISHTSKVMLYVIKSRLEPFLIPQISPEQAGFMKNRGTREQILNIRNLIEKAREDYVPIVLCFVDFEKAFDSIIWKKLWDILKIMGVPNHLVKLVECLYNNSLATIKVDNSLSKKVPIRRGVRQGCVLSPLLYNIYSEYVMRLVLESWDKGISIGGTKISNLRFADDTVLITSKEEDLKELLERLENIGGEYGLKINYKKTKSMIVDRGNALYQVKPQRCANCEVVDSFVYLGSLIHESGNCEHEIRRRIQLGRVATTQLTRVWKDRSIYKSTKIKLVHSLVFPVFGYASETWVIRQADRRRIEAFEMWVWRRLLRIPWTARRTNISVLNEIQPKQRLSTLTYRKILKFFGHVIRSDNIERLMIQGKTTGKRRRGRSPTRWTDVIIKLLDTRLETAVRETQDRHKWRNTIHRVIQQLEDKTN